MSGVFEITFEDIQRLDPLQLTKLLKTLLYLETRDNGIYESSVTVPLKITVPDGGEDGRVEWTDGPERTKWLSRRLCLFQSKAEAGMAKSDFRNASLVSAPKADDNGPLALKTQVAKVLDDAGAYIFFYSKHLTKEQIDERIEGIRDALRLAQRTDAETAIVDIYDANKIADWSNEHLSVVVRICEWTKQDIPHSIQPWESWSTYREHQLFSFVEHDSNKSDLFSLRDHLSQPQRVARIIGLPGLGKSRLAIEALSQPEELMHRVVYIDASMPRNDLPDFTRQYRQRRESAIFVVDNCNLQLHQILRKEVTHQDSRLSLLTIDFDPSERTGNPASDPVIVVSESSDELIRKLLDQVFGASLSPAEIDRIVHFAQGYPLIAALIAQDRIDGRPDAGSLNDDQLLERLVWGRRSPDEEVFNVLSACALFGRLGFDAEETHERILVAENFLGVDPEKFYRHCQHFISRKIIQQHGDFIMVVPTPLAVRLSAEWWRKCSPEKAKSLMASKLPPGLTKALCDQVKMLHYLPKVKDLTKDLCGEQGPFGNAEVLNTERGSLLFRAFAVVSPEDSIENLNRVFGTCSREQLLAVDQGRRNLVWALEDMCFWESTFPVAARLMLDFAAAENETWGNNATGQFVELYQLYLPGTKAPLALRANILEEAITSKSKEKVIVVLKAAERAFQIAHYSRTGGVELQGSRAIEKDYEPKTGPEIQNYWQRCLNVLVMGALNPDDGIRVAALSHIETVIYSCISKHFLDPLLEVIKKILASRNFFWLGALQRLDFALRQSGAEFGPDEKDKIDQMYALLNPRSLADKLTQWVSNPSWDYMHHDKDGNVVDEFVAKAKQVVGEFVSDKSQWDDLLPIVLSGQQKNGFIFGTELASTVENVEDLINAIMMVLERLPENAGNPVVLGGVLAEISNQRQELVTSVLDAVAAKPKLQSYLITLTTLIKLEEADLNRCLELLNQGNISVETFSMFSYGAVLSHISHDVVAQFVSQFLHYGPAGQRTALTVLSMFCFRSDDKWAACRQTFREIILSINLLDHLDKLSQMDTHTWQKTCKKLLESDVDIDVANHIVRQMVNVCASAHERVYYNFDRSFKPLLKILLSDRYLNHTWSQFGDALLADDWRLNLHMQWLFGEHIKELDNEPGVLFTLPDDFLLEWAASNHRAAMLLARLVPVIVETHAESGESFGTIHQLAKRLIDQNGDNDQFLATLSSNIGSFGWVGSDTPHYKVRVAAITELTTHNSEAVRNWALKELSATKARLQYSQKRDDEHRAGIFEKF